MLHSLVRLLILGIIVTIGSAVFVYAKSTEEIVITETYINVPEGASLIGVIQEVSKKLAIDPTLLRGMFYLQGAQNELKAGTYRFDETVTVLEVVRRLTQSEFGVPEIQVTIIEGLPTFQVAPVIADALPNITTEAFINYVDENKLEGYLYPDTYRFAETATLDDVIQKMRENYERKTSELRPQIEASNYTEDQIITMASLIEGEAGSASLEIKREVAGVLWNRVERGMLVQADAVFPFIFQEPIPRVLFRHLEVDSPYNIYKNTGLPPGPINHPSVDSIAAAVNPLDTPYLFYLTGFDGRFYFAKTNSGHERNRRLHLNYR